MNSKVAVCKTLYPHCYSRFTPQKNLFLSELMPVSVTHA